MQKVFRKSVFRWALFDFATQPFPTIVITFVYSVFFKTFIAGDSVDGASQWAFTLSSSGFLIAVLSPIMGRIADKAGRAAKMLLQFTAVTILCTLLLFFVQKGMVLAALGVVLIANTFFELAMVLYNAILPDLADEDELGRVSGIAWGAGYLGGIISLVLILFLFVLESRILPIPDINGLPIRSSMLFISAWMLLFSIPFFRFALKRQPPSPQREPGIKQAIPLFSKYFRNRPLITFLIARLFYNDALITIFAMGGIYAQEIFAFSMSQILAFGIAINLLAGAGAFLIGFFEDKIGSGRIIKIGIIAMSIATLLAIFTQSVEIFWIAALLLGFFAGSNQAASRAYLARFSDKSNRNELYGLFALTGKMTAFLGPLFFGILTSAFQTPRAGLASVLIFFLIGLLIFTKVSRA